MACAGYPITEAGYCLVHGDPEYLRRSLQTVSGGGAIGFLRGVLIDQDILQRLFDANQTHSKGNRTLREPNFIGAVFLADVSFERVEVVGESSWQGAVFSGKAAFEGAKFSGLPNFTGAHFDSEAKFRHGIFTAGADFSGAVFSGGADFSRSKTEGGMKFAGASLLGPSNFVGISGQGRISLDWATITDTIEPAEIVSQSVHVNVLKLT
ncbi:MAG: pentapeptide repeat-containing protein [Gammaproteobacteria bacterium]